MSEIDVIRAINNLKNSVDIQNANHERLESRLDNLDYEVFGNDAKRYNGLKVRVEEIDNMLTPVRFANKNPKTALFISGLILLGLIGGNVYGLIRLILK